MNNHFKKILHYFHEIAIQFNLWFKEQTLPRKVAILAILATLFFLIGKGIFSDDKVIDENKVVNREVKVASVASLSNIEGDFPLIGTVTSVSEATIRSEGSGKLVRVYKKLGDTVSAGTVIAEFENSGERAAVLQAEGAYEQAKASRENALVSGNITSINTGQSGNTLAETKTQVINALGSAYTSMDDAIRGKTDAAFKDPEFQDLKFLPTVPDANLIINLENKRRTIQTLLKSREAKNKTLTQASDLNGELNTIQNELQMIKTYLDDLFTAYSKALPDTTYTQASIDAGKANVQAARQSINGAISSVVSSRTSLSASVAANQVAGNQTTQTNVSLLSAEAQVKQAQGAYNAALSRLEKTVIRSPINGTLNSLTISTGDYIGAFTQVAVVSNNGALEVVSQVTEDDAKRITVGSPVTINEKIAGVVTRVASAIDPTTNKIEIRVGIKDQKSGLINGQSARVLISKDTKTPFVKAQSGPIVIPISALKLTPRGATVFSVTASSTLRAIPVKEGAILGEQIQILEGLTGSEEIVVDARGLKEGSVVEVTK